MFSINEGVEKKQGVCKTRIIAVLLALGSHIDVIMHEEVVSV
jgi:hypothetical protein